MKLGYLGIAKGPQGGKAFQVQMKRKQALSCPTLDQVHMDGVQALDVFFFQKSPWLNFSCCENFGNGECQAAKPGLAKEVGPWDLRRTGFFPFSITS